MFKLGTFLIAVLSFLVILKGTPAYAADYCGGASGCAQGGSCNTLSQYCLNKLSCAAGGGTNVDVFKCLRDDATGPLTWHHQGQETRYTECYPECGGAAGPSPTGPVCSRPPFQALFQANRSLVPGESVSCETAGTGQCQLCQGAQRSGECSISAGSGNCSVSNLDCYCKPFNYNCTYTVNGQTINFPNQSGQIPNPENDFTRRIDLPVPPPPPPPPVPSETPVPTPTPSVNPCESCGTNPNICVQNNCGNACNANGVCYFAGNPTPTDRPPTGIPSPTPSISSPPPPPPPPPPVCREGQTVCTCSGADAGHCSQCNGGWCAPNNPGEPSVCQTCSYIPGPPATCIEGHSCDCRPGESSCTIRFPNGDGVCAQTSRGHFEIISCGPSGASPTRAPSPTGSQPTQIITQPAPTEISHRAFSPQGRPTQKWVCVDSKPCSTGGCSAQAPDALAHRAKLTSKTDAPSLPNAGTYIFECLKLNDSTHRGTFCTTGNSTLDMQKLGVSYLADLQHSYGYAFEGFFAADGHTRVNSPITTNSQGYIQNTNSWYEWQSNTGPQTGRIFLAMNELSDNSGGGNTGQKQATFGFDNPNRNCVMIKWDPYGVVFDSQTQKPIKDAVVTLYMKNDKGTFVKVTNEDVLGGIQNPIVTGEDGGYDFGVSSGTYKLEVVAKGYHLVTDSTSSQFTNIYTGKDIVVKDKKQLVNIALAHDSLLQKIVTFFQK